MADGRIGSGMMVRSNDSKQVFTPGSRTFSYLGPDSASLKVRMRGRQRMSDGVSIRTWSFGKGFNGDRTVPSPVIIRPADGSTKRAWTNGPTFDKEYIWHLHTFDSSWHRSKVSGANTVRHRPDYFMINGRDGFDTLTDPTTAIEAGPGEKVLIRCTNVGYQLAQVQLGGLPFDVIASDGRPLAETISTTSLVVAPGERYDILLTMPSSGKGSATVDYLHIRGDGTLLGTASASIAVV